MTGLLGKNAIVAASDRREKIVDVPEWGGKVRVLTLVGEDRVEFERLSRAQAKGDLTPTQLAAQGAFLGIVDQDGQRVFRTADDYALLIAKSPAPLHRILAGVFDVCRIGDEEVEEALGESLGDPTESSSSDSV